MILTVIHGFGLLQYLMKCDCVITIYEIYLAVILIGQFGNFGFDHQI